MRQSTQFWDNDSDAGGVAVVMTMREMTGDTASGLNELLAEWLGLEPLETRTHAWHRRFDADGIAPGPFNDRAVLWLRAQGARGATLDQLWHSFWLSRLP